MTIRPISRALVFATFVLGMSPSPSVAQSLEVRSADGRISVAAAADWADLQRGKIVLSNHGQARTYEGPLLVEVLRRAGAAPSGPLRGAELRQAVLVQAADGYAVAYGLGELDPLTRAASVILADRVDGQPLSPEEGPLRVIVDGDARPARSVRGVAAVSVIDLAPDAAPRPDPGHDHPTPAVRR